MSYVEIQWKIVREAGDPVKTGGTQYGCEEIARREEI